MTSTLIILRIYISRKTIKPAPPPSTTFESIANTRYKESRRTDDRDMTTVKIKEVKL